MATNRLDPAKQPEESLRNGQEGQAAPAPASGGGMKAWIPLLANIILMPAIAYALTTFVLIPKLGGSTAPAPEGEAGAHGAASPGGGKGKAKFMASLSGKILVNVAGTMGTRYLVANMTLVGSTADFKAKIEENDPQLRDAAASILAVKTIPDIEKPGVRNLIRMEIISAFNDILGPGAVTDLYLTEFAIQ